MKIANLVKFIGIILGLSVIVSSVSAFTAYAAETEKEEAVTEETGEQEETVPETVETNPSENEEINTETSTEAETADDEGTFFVDRSESSAGSVMIDDGSETLSGFSRCRVEFKFVSTEGEPVPDVQVAIYKVQNGGISQNSAAMTDEVRKYYTQAEKEAVEEGKITAAKGTIDYMEQAYDYLTGLHSSIKPEQILVSDYQGRCSIMLDVSDKGTDDAVYFVKQTGASQDAVMYNRFSSFLVSVPERNDDVIRSVSEFTITMLEPGEYLMFEAAQDGGLLIDDSVESTVAEETEDVADETAVGKRVPEPLPEETYGGSENESEDVVTGRHEIVVSVPTILVMILALILAACFGFLYSIKKQNPDKTMGKIVKNKAKKENKGDEKDW